MAEQSAISNGPVGEVSSGDHVMSTKEMRLKSDHWTLAGDAGLLNYLQEFSQKMISKTHEMEQLMNSVAHEAKVTDAKVSNLMNDFHMLSNTQFVESRVYDEEIQDERTKNKKAEVEPKSKEQRETELVSKVTAALNLGLVTLEQAFDKVELQEDSDSEDDDSLMKGGIILEPKDPYLQRPLPVLIGSAGFLTDDYVGLQDVLSEEELSPEKDVESEPSSESESEPELRNIAQHKPKDLSDSESVASDLFPSGAEDGESFSRSSSVTTESEAEKVVNHDQTDRGEPIVADGKGLLAEELEARLHKYSNKPPIKTRESRAKSDTSSIHSRTSRKSSASVKPPNKSTPVKKAPSDEDLFGHAEIPEEDDAALFGRKGGLFAASGKLFENDGDGLFDDVKQNPPEEEKLITPQSRGRTKSGRKIPTGAVSVLADGDIFNTPKSPAKVNASATVTKPVTNSTKEEATTRPIVTVATAVPPVKVKGGLFDDSEDEDDLFSSIVKPAASQSVSAPKAAPVAAKAVDLFASDEEGNDLFEVKTSAPVEPIPKKKLPAGAVPIFGNMSGNMGFSPKTIKPTNKDADSDNSSDSGPSSGAGSNRSRSSIPNAGSTISKPSPVPTKQSRSNSVSSNSLFAEDPDTDDLFSSISRRDSKQSLKEPKKNFLFDDDQEDLEGSGLFSSQPFLPTVKSGSENKPRTDTSKTVTDLFNDVDEDDSLFAAISKPLPSTQKTASGLSLLEEKKSVISPTATDETKLEVKPKIASIPEKKVSLFDEEETDDNLFAVPSSSALQSPESNTSRSQEDSVKTPTSPITPKHAGKGKDEVDSDRLKPVVAEQDTRTRTTSLFDDDHLLFGGPPNESPEVDLFTAEAPQKVEAPKASPSKNKPVGGVALFGGVDLFAGKMPARKESSTSPKNDEIMDALQSKDTSPVLSQEPIRHAPTLKETKDISVSFDDPVDTSNTLQSAAKDRAKVQVKRRPPSRKGRHAASRNSGLDFETKIPETAQFKPTVQETGSPAPTLTNQPQTSESHNDPVVKQDVTKISDSFLSVSKDWDLQSPSTEEEDLFSVGEPKKDNRLFMGKGGTPAHEQSASKSDTNKVTKQPDSKDVRKESIKKVNIFASDDEDDIFSNVTSTKNGVENATAIKVSIPKLQTENGDPSIKVDDLFGESGEEDIFASVPSKKMEVKTAKYNPRSIFDEDEDEGDIFAAPQSTPKVSQASISKPAAVRKTLNSSAVDVFEDPLLSAHKDGN